MRISKEQRKDMEERGVILFPKDEPLILDNKCAVIILREGATRPILMMPEVLVDESVTSNISILLAVYTLILEDEFLVKLGQRVIEMMIGSKMEEMMTEDQNEVRN